MAIWEYFKNCLDGSLFPKPFGGNSPLKAIYVAARKACWIDSVRERLDRLREAGFWLRDRDYAAVLDACGEAPGGSFRGQPDF